MVELKATRTLLGLSEICLRQCLVVDILKQGKVSVVNPQDGELSIEPSKMNGGVTCLASTAWKISRARTSCFRGLATPIAGIFDATSESDRIPHHNHNQWFIFRHFHFSGTPIVNRDITYLDRRKPGSSTSVFGIDILERAFADAE
jgi:hypothetical protein